MRHRTLLTSLLLAALLLGGWGGVVAAAFCAHDGAQRAAMTEEHDCCRAQLEQQHKEHCDAASNASPSHEAMTMGEMETTAAAAATQQSADAVVALNQLDEACLHCVSRRDVPTTFVIARQPEQKKRDASFAAPPQLLLLAAPVHSFAPTLNATQNAPPGVAARRHLLIGVFII